MDVTREQPIFENRYDAGRQLAVRLGEYQGRSAVVLAVPNGGLPVALGVALAINAELDVVVSRKLPLPLKPEAGFGAIADDGEVILNEEVVQKVGLSVHQINYQINRVRAEIRQRSLLYRKDRKPTILKGKTVIIIDDGLASGFTMVAALESVRRRKPKEITVAVPAASAGALKRVSKVAERVVTMAVGSRPKFFIADFYRYWHDVSDSEALQCLKEWWVRRFQAGIAAAGDKKG